MVPSTIRTTSVVVQRRHFVVPNFDTGDGWDSLVSRVCVCVCMVGIVVCRYVRFRWNLYVHGIYTTVDTQSLCMLYV